MAEKEIQLPNGDTIIVDEDRRKVPIFIGDLYQYRLVDDSSQIVKGKGKIFANEDDVIFSYELGWLRCARADYTAYVNELVVWKTPKDSSDVGVEDVLLGVAPGYSSETWRVYIDTLRTFPYRMDINAALTIYGSEAKEVRVFRGTDITSQGEVVSAYYANGEYVSDAIPLELSRTDDQNNLTQRNPVMGYTTKNFQNGEVVTVVVYNHYGAVISIAKMLVHLTNNVRHPDEGMKRVKSIEIVSSYLSPTEPYLLEVPINALVSDLGMRAKVTYTDGSSHILDVTDEEANGKFMILGLKYWSPSVGGTSQEITLRYHLDENEEYSYTQGETFDGSVIQPYMIRAKPADPAYSLKLYVFPTWVNSLSGYALDYWLFDANRQLARRVPRGAVSLSETSAPFDGLDYTSVQLIQFSVDLSVMDEAYGEHVHVQAVQIALLRDGGQRATNWRLKFSGNQPKWFGDNLEAAVTSVSGGLHTANIAQGEVDREQWLEKVYYSINPLYDPQTEIRAPEPTHFVLVTKTRVFEFPITQWAMNLTFINDLANGEVLYVRWLRRMAGGVDLQLGVSGLPVHTY